MGEEQEQQPARWLRIKTLFGAALDVPASERAALLARESADDASLIADVQSLLAAHEQPGAFLEPVADELRAEALSMNDSHVGERIGAYRIAGLLGTGGMGDVYKAVRDDDQYRAEVAIKLMRADMRNPLSEQRFRNERQILAALDHRNIARLLDGGTTSQGIPYVVMELVAGEPIDLYCDARSLGARERVRLFLQVCAAVSFAHQHLVVHRDLKPNNILVTADGSVKLLDFGIAKLIEPDAITGTNTEETRTQLRAMTLEYASPEQVSGGTVTTVSDVYSLGVVLYRLLTGQSPYGKRANNDAQRMAEILSDTTPTRPSQVETKTREQIDADLDHILLMSLRKEPAKRYGSVEQFANDLRNHLNGLPVAARRGTLGYRFSKFVRRNKVSIAASVLVALSLVTGLGLAIREARIAEQQRAVAQRHFDSVRKLANTLIIDVYDEISDLPGAMKVRGKLAHISQQYLDELSREPGSDRGLQEELATAFRKLGDIQGGQNSGSGGDSTSALESYGKSIALLENILAVDPGNQSAGAGLAKSLVLQSRVLIVTKGPAAALAPARRSVQLGEAMRKGFASDYHRANLLSVSYQTLADVLMALQKPDEALEMYDKLVTSTETYASAHPDDVPALKLLRNAYTNSAIAIDPRASAQETFARTSGLMRKSLDVSEKLLVMDPTSTEHVTRLAEQRLNFADALANFGDYRAAADMYRLAAPALAKAAEEKDDARAQLAKAMNDTGLGAALAKSGDSASAIPLFKDAERSLTELLGKDPENMSIQFVLAQVEIYRGEMYAQLEHWRQANASLEPGVARILKINEQYPLSGSEKVVMDTGTAALSRTRAALTP